MVPPCGAAAEATMTILLATAVVVAAATAAAAAAVGQQQGTGASGSGFLYAADGMKPRRQQGVGPFRTARQRKKTWRQMAS